MNRWLFKTEPSAYSFGDLEREKRTVWDGVRNPQALKHLARVKRGDRVFVYHTGNEKAVVGIARAASDPYPDPAAKDPRRLVVDLEPVRRLRRPVSLARIKAESFFRGFDLVRLPRLSVMPLTAQQWGRIEALAEEEE